MGHVRLFFLVAAAISSAYLLLCLVAPTSLSFEMEQSCRPSDRFSSPLRTEVLPVSIGVMTLQTLETGIDQQVIDVTGTWGRHRLHMEEVSSDGECRRHLFWESTHWPLLLRGAAGLLSLREQIQAELEED
jgi:hypothetical protein